jgi:glyoxylase-like metal-dependent hydrolase (beta-lactamase superfamily II)
VKIHHLDCATMLPFGGRLLTGTGGPFVGRLVAHCLLIETDHGLVLVDTGLGTGDIADPARLGASFRLGVRPELRPTGTAVHQVQALGFAVEDVRDIVLTHLDADHAGGIGDFPAARVHLSGAELDAALQPPTKAERDRYRAAQWAHGPTWVTHDDAGGEDWFGFTSVRALDGQDDILLIPLPGHTRGHCGVAVRTAEGWLLHAGDSYFFHTELTEQPSCPPAQTMLQRIVEVDRPTRLHNQARLRELRRDHADDVTIFCAHDPAELALFG